MEIRRLAAVDRDDALDVINEAARWYREFLPPGEVHEPEMTSAGWDEEARRMTWYGARIGGRLVAVMGMEPVRDAVLMRHAYVRPEHQHHGLGLRLLRHLEGEVPAARRIIVGTYAANYKARGALEKAGYRLSADSQAILRTYYAIPEDRQRSSVTYEKPG